MNITPLLNLHILSIGSDGALVEYQAQTMIQSMATNKQLQLIDIRFDIIFSCLILPLVGPIDAAQIQILKSKFQITKC
jgi:hypothetical protein